LIRTVAGTGDAGESGDGGPAGQGQLHQPAAPAVAKDGTIWFADIENGSVRAVDLAGSLRTVLGRNR
jgi:hypothetical protein